MSEVTTIIIDNGSYTCKGGFNGQTSPQANIPLVGRFGSSGSVLIEKTPIERGTIVNWDDMEKIWSHMITNELKTNASEHPILMTEPPMNAEKDRERMAQVMFETFNVPSFFVGTSSVLALYSAGHKSGLSVEIGHGVTHVVPVHDGYAIKKSSQRLNLGGYDVTNHLVELLGDRRCDFCLANKMKEEHCYVALDVEEEIRKLSECTVSFTLADGNVINISKERFQCSEVLFDPSHGLHESVVNSIVQCDEAIRGSLFGTIIVSGGTSLLRGLPERLNKEVLARAPASTRVNVTTPLERRFASWAGGSILASLDPFSEMVVTRSEYSESGPRIISRKCP